MASGGRPSEAGRILIVLRRSLPPPFLFDVKGIRRKKEGRGRGQKDENDV